MSRADRKAKRQGSKPSAGLPIVLTVLLLAAAGGFLFYLHTADDYSCSEEGSYMVTAVIIDTSDPLVPYQLDKFKNFTEALISPGEHNDKFVARGEWLAVYRLLDVEGGEPEKIFADCMPANPAAQTELKRNLTEPEIRVYARWRSFVEKLTKSLETGTSGEAAPVSPILETIHRVRIKEFPDPEVLRKSGARAGKIYIVSDFLENTSKVSHFTKELPDPNTILDLMPFEDLTGVEVRLLYLTSEKYKDFQQPAHITWWRKVLAISGGPLKTPPEIW